MHVLNTSKKLRKKERRKEGNKDKKQKKKVIGTVEKTRTSEFNIHFKQELLQLK